MQIDVESKSGGKRLKGLSAPSNPDHPRLTVITVVLNGDKYLESSILSVLRTNYNKPEYIIVDGGSTDGTLDILRKYEGSIDYWISEPDRGIYDAMNKAVRLAHGRWVYFLGSDDTLRDNLASVADCLVDEQIIYYGNVFMTGSRKKYDGPFGAWKLSRQFSLRYPLLADWEFNLWCYSNPHFRFQYIPVTVANYNDIRGMSSVGVDGQFLIDQDDIIRECLPAACYAWYRVKKIARAAIGPAKVLR
jgi:glycosyltransferase involved in cell wall biosynthesis